MKDRREALILAEVLVMLSFAAAILSSLSTSLFSILSLLFLLAYTCLFYQDRKLFGEDFQAFFFFFLILLFSSLLIPLAQIIFPVSIFRPQNFVYGLGLLLGFIGISLLSWKLRFGRNYCFGKVIMSDRNSAVVRVGFDICSGVKEGDYVVSSKTKVRKGKTVRMAVSRNIPREII